MDTTPQGWTQTTLGEILTESQLNRLTTLYRKAGGDVQKLIELVKPWFNQPAMRDQLIAKGLLPEFAAYAIPFHYAKAMANT